MFRPFVVFDAAPTLAELQRRCETQKLDAAKSERCVISHAYIESTVVGSQLKLGMYLGELQVSTVPHEVSTSNSLIHVLVLLYD